MRKTYNASILVDGKTTGVYGVFIDELGEFQRCSEVSALPDPIAWLSARYPDQHFELIRDNGEAYYADLWRSVLDREAPLQ